MAEAANGPTTPEADEILFDERRLPDPGHPVQRRRRDRQLLRVGPGPEPRPLERGEVNEKLKEIMVKAFHEVLTQAKRERVNMRTGAYLTRSSASPTPRRCEASTRKSIAAPCPGRAPRAAPRLTAR